jgi:hypothetical protein
MNPCQSPRLPRRGVDPVQHLEGGRRERQGVREKVPDLRLRRAAQHQDGHPHPGLAKLDALVDERHAEVVGADLDEMARDRDEAVAVGVRLHHRHDARGRDGAPDRREVLRDAGQVDLCDGAHWFTLPQPPSAAGMSTASPLHLLAPDRNTHGKVADMKRMITTPLVGLSLLAATLTGCGTIGGTAVGAGAGAAVGAGTGYGAGKGALIGAGVGAAAGAIYDITKKN